MGQPVGRRGHGFLHPRDTVFPIPAPTRLPSVRAVLAFALLATLVAAPGASAVCQSPQGQICVEPDTARNSAAWTVDGDADPDGQNNGIGKSSWHLRGGVSASGLSGSGKVWNQQTGLVEPEASADTSQNEVSGRLWSPRSAQFRVGATGLCLASDLGTVFRC